MLPLKSRGSPEHQQQQALRRRMEQEGWLTEKVHGNLYQSGWPDLFCHHLTHGARWIELKRSAKTKLRPSQVGLFTRWSHYGVNVWVLTGPEDYVLLFKPPNWRNHV
jgi:hypothetical protein